MPTTTNYPGCTSCCGGTFTTCCPGVSLPDTLYFTVTACDGCGCRAFCCDPPYNSCMQPGNSYPMKHTMQVDLIGDICSCAPNYCNRLFLCGGAEQILVRCVDLAPGGPLFQFLVGLGGDATPCPSYDGSVYCVTDSCTPFHITVPTVTFNGGTCSMSGVITT